MDEEFINRTDGDLPGTMNDSLKGLGQVPQLRPLEPTKQKFNNVTLKFQPLEESRAPSLHCSGREPAPQATTPMPSLAKAI
ncbi:hypothetical protein FOTG_08761 [Fusarium oxysporum f. sp. vasinfectum 25433]|uniref:Uncharacterized protein n=1 Tax=Fusarium oxysporum f. sp. vasinfectum 25433 TaxID=1089449 RepID=X0MVF2_FUSOX|nr:hypothetical protein FOTG_08761 [Fusarium oxysporum f. sp. vasinfectum 25433]